MNNSNSHDSHDSQSNTVEAQDLDRSPSQNDRRGNQSPEKIIVNPIGFRHHNVSVSESASPSQEHSIRNKNFISPVKKSQYRPQTGPILPPQYAISPTKDGEQEDQQNGMSSVGQSFAADAEELVQAVSRNPISPVQRSPSVRHERHEERDEEEGRREELGQDEESEDRGEEDEEEQEEKEEEQEEEQNQEEEEQPMQPDKDVSRRLSRSISKNNSSQEEKLAQSQSKQMISAMGDEAEQEEQAVQPLLQNLSQKGKSDVVKLGDGAADQIEREHVSESSMRKEDNISQVNVSRNDRQEPVYNRINLEEDMRNHMGPRETSRDENNQNIYTMSERQATHGLMLKEGKQISVTQDSETFNSGLNKLAAMNGLCFRQKFDVIHGITACEVQQRTYVHDYSVDGKIMEGPMFQVNENSSYCAKQCLSNYCRPFDVRVNMCNSRETIHLPFLSIEKSCACTCLWFNRPSVHVRLIENGRSTYIGKIKDAFKCGDIRLDVFDHDDILRYVIEGNCCQCGMMCNCGCKSCQTVDFLVRPTGQGRIVYLQKKNASLSEAKYPHAERFTLGFDEDMTPEDRALLLGAIVFLESRHFEGDP